MKDIMNKDEFFKKKQELNEALENLDLEYIEANAKLKRGDRIKITSIDGKVRHAFVTGNKIKWNADVTPTLVKEKKDGTASSVSDNLWNSEVWEKVEKK